MKTKNETARAMYLKRVFAEKRPDGGPRVIPWKDHIRQLEEAATKETKKRRR